MPAKKIAIGLLMPKAGKHASQVERYVRRKEAVIRVIDVLDLFATGLNAEQILEELPDLEMDDIKAALNYAARRLDRPVMVA